MIFVTWLLKPSWRCVEKAEKRKEQKENVKMNGPSIIEENRKKKLQRKEKMAKRCKNG